MKASYAVVIICIAAMTVLVSGCMGPGETWANTTVERTPDLFRTGQVSWYEYNMSESYSYEGWAPDYGYQVRVKVESGRETWQGTPATHKLIRNYYRTDSPDGYYYDVYLDDQGRILEGNYTYVHSGDAQRVHIPRGKDYAQAIGYLDAPARILSENSSLSSAGYETITYAGKTYDCTIYTARAGGQNFTVWHSPALSMPLKIIAHPDSSEPNVQRTYELIGYGSNGGNGIVIPTPAPVVETTVTPTPEAEIIVSQPPVVGPTGMPAIHPGTTTVFDLDGITWYQYVVTVPTNETIRHQKLKVSYDDRTVWTTDSKGVYVGIPQKRTTIDLIWMGEDLSNRVTIYENESGGNVTSGYSMPGNHSLDAGQARAARNYDISTRFNGTTEGGLEFTGDEIVRYNGEKYSCDVYELTVGNDTFKVWKNSTIPLPLKIIADYEDRDFYFGHPDDTPEAYPVTYELLDWS